MDSVHLSAYGRIVEALAREGGAHPTAILTDMQRPYASDMLDMFREDCERAQIPVPSDDETPELLKKLWDHYTR